MATVPDVVWLSTSPSFQRFNRSTLALLAHSRLVAQWEYHQSVDEGCSLTVAIDLLHDYLGSLDRPVHLVGHSTSGLLGLLYACQYPDQVRSLTLLSVGMNPAIDWQSHFYTVLQLLPCDRQKILMQMIHNLFGYRSQPQTLSLINLLEQDLACSLSPHSLLKRASIMPVVPDVPLLVCGSEDDVIVDRTQIHRWTRLLKRGDRLWIAPEGRHFFHYFHPQAVVDTISQFWDDLETLPTLSHQAVA